MMIQCKSRLFNSNSSMLTLGNRDFAGLFNWNSFMPIQDFPGDCSSLLMVRQNYSFKFVYDYSWVFTIIYDYSEWFGSIQDFKRLWRFWVVAHILKAIIIHTKKRLAGRLLRNMLSAYKTGQL